MMISNTLNEMRKSKFIMKKTKKQLIFKYFMYLSYEFNLKIIYYLNQMKIYFKYLWLKKKYNFRHLPFKINLLNSDSLVCLEI